MLIESPYRKFFSAQILKLQESGVLAHLKDQWWRAEAGKGKYLNENNGLKNFVLKKFCIID